MTTEMESLEQVSISTNLQQNDAFLKQLLGIGVSWDLIAKPFVYEQISMTGYTANGFFLTMNMVLILENVEMSLKEFVARHPARDFTIDELVNYLNVTISFVQVQKVNNMKDAVRYILSGPLVIFLDGYNETLMIDTRIYPMRSIAEPEVERVVRGPRDGFVETMLMNVALIRRRLRDPRLRVELIQVGTRSQTDVSVMYLQDVTNDALVDNVKKELKSINTDVVAMGEQAVTEFIAKVKWNPYPIVRYTERPDVAATCLMEGQIVIVVDTTPEVIIAPSTLFNHIHHPEDYHVYPTNGTYMRVVSILGALISVFSPSFFIVAAQLGKVEPRWLARLVDPAPLSLPLAVQFLLAQLAVDLFERAVINTPTALATATGIVAGLVFGPFAVSMNLVSPEVLVFMGSAMVAQFATSSHELSTANRFVRFILIIVTSVGGWIGFILGIIGLIVLLATTKSFGVPYLWPFLPFDWEGIKGVLIRAPLYRKDGRPSIFKTKTLIRRG
ncbi:spore germination protein [Ferroacidibacillus organovorans]|nr:spore germination protein [Ferroacidibacillus organovorans]